MIKVDFTEPKTLVWSKWKAKAQQETNALLQAAANNQVIKIKESLYKRTRNDIYHAFHGKCAYCEAHFILDQAGDIEHYRPKKAVCYGDDTPVPNHPGYYWLAYEWTNLLPSCSLCNRPHRNELNKLVGKGIRFPVLGRHASRPDEIPQEQPLLLHPVYQDPTNHLLYDESTGMLGYKTLNGKECIEILDLNREGLPEARKEAYYAVLAKLISLFGAVMNGNFNLADEYLKMLSKVRSGQAEYAMAGRAALHAQRQRAVQYLLDITELIRTTP